MSRAALLAVVLAVIPDARADKPAKPDAARVAAARESAKHLRAGRARMRKADWAAAATELDAALAAVPDEGWALTERGYVALQAGDLPLAAKHTEAATRDPRPRVQGAAYYNLAQIDEKRGDAKAALEHYVKSYEASSSVAASKKIVALGGKVPHPGLIEDGPSPCASPVPEGKLCTCLKKQAAEDSEEGAAIACREAEVEHGAPGLKVLAVGDLEETSLQLVARVEGGWSAVGEVATFFGGGTMQVDWAVGKIERRRIGDVDTVWVETAEDTSDNDLGVDEVQLEHTRSVTVCRLGAAARCLLHVPVEHTSSRDRLGTMEDGEIDAETRASMSKGLPWSGEIKLAVDLDTTGLATVKKVSEKGGGKLDFNRWRAYVGQVKLW